MSASDPAQTITLRHPVAADAPAVLDVLLARDVADLGHPDFTLEDLLDVWGRSEFDLSRDAVVCEAETGEIVGYAEVGRRAGDVYVSPQREGEGIGTRLIGWLLAEERERAAPYHRQAIPHSNKRAAELLKAHGYAYFLSYSRMARSLGEAPEPATLSDGVSTRPLCREQDAEAVYEIDRLAFLSSPDYIPMTFTAFCEEHLDQHDHAPELSLVAEVEGEIAGILLASRRDEERAGYVDILAVGPDHQGKGIGTTLLHTAIALFAGAGLSEAQLGVASTNPGARGLYERAGMSERFRVDLYERPRDPS